MARTILDTGVLWNPEAMDRARRMDGVVVLPAVAFTERARQIAQAGRTVDELWRLVRSAGLLVESFRIEHGLMLAARLDDVTWRRHARDALIAGHVGPGDVLWTTNPRDFAAVGLPSEQVLAV